jgi:hypothetical protein
MVVHAYNSSTGVAEALGDYFFLVVIVGTEV